MKRIVTLQDISCVGCCSITVALPIISAMGVECGILPTAVLSNHTMFKGFTCKDISDQIEPISDMWEKENITFDGVYTGYLASEEQCAQVVRFFERFSNEGNLTLVDPAMADNGKLYPAFGEDFPKAMADIRSGRTSRRRSSTARPASGWPAAKIRRTRRIPTCSAARGSARTTTPAPRSKSASACSKQKGFCALPAAEAGGKRMRSVRCAES